MRWVFSTHSPMTDPLVGLGYWRSVIKINFDMPQYTLSTFFTLHPFGKVMQAESVSRTSYDRLGRFEKGKSKGKLTRTDSVSWQDKSWVLGVEVDGRAKAYDWLQLKQSAVLNDMVGSMPIVIAIASDGQSFAAFRKTSGQQFTFRNDSLIGAKTSFDLAGRSADGTKLEPVNAHQEFWHSWRQFHPDTEIYR